MQVIFAGIKLQSVSLVWDYNELSNEASLDLSQHPLGFVDARRELELLNYPGIEIKDRFAIISDVKAFKSLNSIHAIPKASTSMSIQVEPSSESESTSSKTMKRVVIHPSGQIIPVISFAPSAPSIPSTLSTSSDAVPIDSAKKSPHNSQTSPGKKSLSGNTSPTSYSDDSSTKTLSPRKKSSPRNLWGMIRQGSSSIETSPRLKKTLSKRSIFSPKPVSVPHKPAQELISIKSRGHEPIRISLSYLSKSATLPFDSIAIDKLFSNENDAPGQWADTLAYHTHWIGKNEEEIINSGARFLRSKNDMLSNQGFICKKRLYAEKNKLIMLLSELMNKYIDPIYQLYLAEEKPDREEQRHTYSYFRQAILDAMLDNKLQKNPNELKSLTKEEKHERFHGNHHLYLFANQQLDSERTQLKLFRLMLLVSPEMPISILDKEGQLVQKGISWMRNSCLKHLPRQMVISELLKQVENIIIEIEKIQRLINRDTRRITDALDANEPLIRLRQQLRGITTEFDEYHSYHYILQKRLEEKLPKSSKMTEEEFMLTCSKTAQELTLLTIHKLHLQFMSTKPDRRFMSFLTSRTDLSYIDTGTDKDFYLHSSWAERISELILHYPVNPKLPLKEKSKRFQDFKNELTNEITASILGLYAGCFDHPIASSSYS